ncbi:UNVERIFIED_CONTAM: hypothetical protein Slati_2212100 [Sesamum latifolium]|uniref:Reverse transcriptase domain-containing protein n=1 Tax=Sesamum latifolium TaxID=2727402 RepID=A0AAW2WSX4_9LAMI
MHKSQLIVSKAAMELKPRLLHILGFQEGSLPVRYLGLPLVSSHLTVKDCQPLIRKVDERLRGWDRLHLSYAARVQLLRSVITSLNIYWAMAFILPKGVIKTIEARMRTFLWQGGTEWAWPKWLGLTFETNRRGRPSPSQNAFVPGRRISNNTLIGQELFHGYNQQNLPPRCALKVNLQKAYDTLEWDFIHAMLSVFGFPEKMIMWIVECISTTTYSVALNVNYTGSSQVQGVFVRVTLCHLTCSFWLWRSYI